MPATQTEKLTLGSCGSPPLILKEQLLLQITFDVKTNAIGTALVNFSTAPFPNLGDTLAQTQMLDEAVGGDIRIF